MSALWKCFEIVGYKKVHNVRFNTSYFLNSGYLHILSLKPISTGIYQYTILKTFIPYNIITKMYVWWMNGSVPHIELWVRDAHVV